MADLPKQTVERVREGARLQRRDKSEEEWRAHLLRTARTQAKILNLVVKHQGPNGMEFRMQVRAGPTRQWVNVEEVEA